MIKDDPRRTGDEDYDNGVTSLFDNEPDTYYIPDLEHATQSKPDAFEIEMGRQEQERKERQFDVMFESIMNGRYK